MKEIISNEKIANLIYDVRGKKVMIDRDLARLYQTETRILNQKVRRNINRFPKEFCFQMSKDEFETWKSQIVMSNNDKLGLRRPPFVFTEQGVAMLSAVINTEVAIDVSITIMNVFVNMKRVLASNYLERFSLEEQVIKNTNDIRLLKEKFENTNNYSGLFFENQIYDAYSLLIDILNSAYHEIILIDNYVDKNLFDTLRKINKNIILVTNKYNNEAYLKYKKQYKNINFIINNSIHDRFIILDRNKLYHCGASFKDLGKKCFAITEITEVKWINQILKELNL